MPTAPLGLPDLEDRAFPADLLLRAGPQGLGDLALPADLFLRAGPQGLGDLALLADRQALYSSNNSIYYDHFSYALLLLLYARTCLKTP